MSRKLFTLAGLFCLLGTLTRAQAPVAQFSASVTSGCAPLQVKFTDQSTNRPTAWEWDFGDGQTSSQQNPTAGFAVGTYTITLIVKNASGADAIRQVNYITVSASPTVSFGLDKNLACAPATINFLQYSQPGQGAITNYAWTFGDGSTGSGATPQHVYTSQGYYNVTLTVTNSGGCSNTATYARVLRLINGVTTNFAWAQTGNACTAPYSLNFINQTSGPGNLSYNWSFGGGAAPSASNASKPAGISYPSSGIYPVTLIAQSSLGCADTLTQNVPLTAMTPTIVGPTAGCVNTPITFTDSSNPAPISSSWNFGDGGPNQSTATHTYTASGTYTITLTNQYVNCTGTTTGTITIGGSLVPSFSATPTTACQSPLSVQFTDNDVPADNQWTWNFGDGTTPVTGIGNPTHNYGSPGNYTVALTATNTSGCTGTDSISKLVKIIAPVINLPQQGACVGQALTPSYSVTTVDPVANYSWSATGATPATATGANPSFTFPATGFYTLTLTITTGTGCSATQTVNVQVGTPTAASFTYNPTGQICGSNVITFTSPSTPVDQYYWNFGDGAPLDSGQTVMHQFLQFGTKNVTLTVTHDGCSTPVTEPLSISPPIPRFGWMVNCLANNPGVSNPLSVTFLDSTTKDATLTLSYDWKFDDGQPDYVTSVSPWAAPTHVFTAPGVYNIELTVTNGGCAASAFKTLTVQDVTASFTVFPNPVCNEQTFTLTSTSVTQPVPTGNSGYIWNITPTEHDRGSSTFSTHFRGGGNYPITLTVIDLNGCQYTSNPVTVTVAAPAVNFTAPPGGCENGGITFTDNSMPSPLGKTNVSYTWRFGDGSLQVFKNPPFIHQYADTGSYTVIETVTDDAGCTNADTVVAAVQITAPHALFLEPDSFYCPNTPATFTDLSTGYSLTETWDFGDGTGPSNSNTHTFPATNGITYPVKLMITDKYGCVKDTTENIRIDSPVAAFTIADTTAICFPLQTLFVAGGQYYDSLFWVFGDGDSSTLASTSHFYNSLDTFTATLVVQGPGGCRDSAKRQVFLTNPATTVFTFTPKTACDSVVAQFNIVPPGYTRFTLQFGDNNSDSSQNPSPIHTYRSPNTFLPLLFLTDATGCIVTESDMALTVLGAVPFFTATPTQFCDTGTVAFTDYTITNNGVLSKTYTFGDGSTLPQPPPLTAPFNTSYFYSTPGNLLATLTVVTLANCTASYTDTIRVFQTPQPIISDTGYLCAGLVQFLGKLVVPDVDTVFWQWDFGNGQNADVQNPLIKAAAGTYIVHLKASVSLGCSDTTSATITINPNPVIKGPKEITTPVGVPVTIPFTYSNDVTTWSWTPMANLSCTNCADPEATLVFAQTYSVLATDSNNCIDTASILIKTVCNEDNYFLPNTFSPNGDGVNDYFYPRGTSLYNIQSLSIFNRWGQMVFQRKNFPANSETMGWDGMVNGKPAPSDAYVYVVEVICSNAQVIALHGNVTLIR